ncbi:hypothetical protein CBR_g33984 [Chara braunii]|uniref:Splicing factor 3A subunit 1 n=1 Tax=Chara braunii TaxID=69332 RepID=A0A388LHK6_CHABU|nr:hypothetical protein CBR_g33984 [Chara braunii]|eukprot:GBG81804.1 hypothetical protein CBR_g33984 [Chara braunii]
MAPAIGEILSLPAPPGGGGSLGNGMKSAENDKAELRQGSSGKGGDASKPALVVPTSTRAVGMIHPPPDIRSIVDKTASFVARLGPEFEKRILATERNNVKFNFLLQSDPYHAYYLHKVNEFKNALSAPQQGAGGGAAGAQAGGAAGGQGGAGAPSAKPGIDGGAAARPGDVRGSAPSGAVAGDGAEESQDGATVVGAAKTLEPPEAEQYTVRLPEGLTGLDLDIIKLTAIFVARNGKAFLTGLTSREHMNPQFHFLKPTHSMFTFFTALADAYSKVLMPPKGLAEKLRRDSQSKTAVLERCLRRLEWEKSQERARQKAEDELEQERFQMALIDWHDFYVVETIQFKEEEDEELPAPLTLEEVVRRSKALSMEDFTEEEVREGMVVTGRPGEDMAMEMDEDEMKMVEEGMKAASIEESRLPPPPPPSRRPRPPPAPLVAGKDQDEQSPMEVDGVAPGEEEEDREEGEEEEEEEGEEEEDEEEEEEEEENEDDEEEKKKKKKEAEAEAAAAAEEQQSQQPRKPEDAKVHVAEDAIDGDDRPIKIVYNYKRPEERATAEKDPTKYVISAITGETIPISEMAEHIRISLIDPKYKEQKERMMAKLRETTLASDEEISKNIVGLAKTRPDIFGTTEEEVSSAVKAELEKKKEEPKQVIWDGHTGSISRTANAAMGQALSLEDQIAQANREKANVGPDGRPLPGPAAPPPPKLAPPPSRPLPPPPGISLNIPRPPTMSSQNHPPPVMLPVVGMGNMNVVRPPLMPPPLARPPTPVLATPPPTVVNPTPLIRTPPMAPPPPPGAAAALSAAQMQFSSLAAVHVAAGRPPPPPPFVAGGGPLAPPPAPAPLPTVPPPPPPLPPLPPSSDEPMIPPLPEDNPPPPPDEPEPKRQKLEEIQLVPEEQFLADHSGPCSIVVSVPALDREGEEHTSNLKGQSIEVQLTSLSETVGTLKGKIAAELGLPASKQKLSSRGGFFKDNLTLAYYNVAPGDIVYLGIKERGGRKK